MKGDRDEETPDSELLEIVESRSRGGPGLTRAEERKLRELDREDAPARHVARPRDGKRLAFWPRSKKETPQNDLLVGLENNPGSSGGQDRLAPCAPAITEDEAVPAPLELRRLPSTARRSNPFSGQILAK